MAIAQVPVTEIIWFCVIGVGVFLIIQNINYLFTVVSNLWSMLPPNDVIARYVVSGTILSFVIYVITYTLILRKSINLETIIKDNEYVVFNKYTASAFCVCFVLAIIYFVYVGDGDGSGSGSGSGSSINFSALIESTKRRFSLIQFAIFAFIFYGLVQMYYMLLWGITPTPMFKA